MTFKIAVPVWCEYEDGFREPEGDVITNRYPFIGEGMMLCDKRLWIVTAVEGCPNLGFPDVICHRADSIFTLGKEPKWLSQRRLSLTS